MPYLGCVFWNDGPWCRTIEQCHPATAWRKKVIFQKTPLPPGDIGGAQPFKATPKNLTLFLSLRLSRSGQSGVDSNEIAYRKAKMSQNELEKVKNDRFSNRSRVSLFRRTTPSDPRSKSAHFWRFLIEDLKFCKMQNLHFLRFQRKNRRTKMQNLRFCNFKVNFTLIFGRYRPMKFKKNFTLNFVPA